MPDVQKTIEILFIATDTASKVFNDVSNEASRMTDHLKEVTGPLSDLALKVELTSAALIGLGRQHKIQKNLDLNMV